jgi:hypothetical protein
MFMKRLCGTSCDNEYVNIVLHMTRIAQERMTADGNICSSRSWSFEREGERLTILIERKSSIETLSIDRALCGNVLNFSFPPTHPALFLEQTRPF